MSDQETPTMQEAVSEAVEPAEAAIQGNSVSDEGDSQPVAQKAAEAKAILKDPRASKSEKKAAEKQLKKIKFQVDGQEYEEEYDPNDENYIREQLQMAKVSRKRMQEKASIEKDVIRFIEDLRNNPKKALSDPALGMDLKKFAQSIIEEEIENSKKSPEQLEKEKLQAELQAIREEREREKTENQQKEFERIKEQEYERYDLLMSQALEKTDLPKSPYIVKKMADYMLLGLQMGKEVTPEDVIPLVREEMQDDLKQMFAVMPDDVVEKLIGQEKLNSIRKKNIAKAKQANNPAVKAGNKVTDTGKKPETKEVNKTVNFKDFFKF